MKKLSLLLVAMIASLASWAVTPPSTTGATPESGKVYYLYNVGAAMYMNHGSSWGTHVTVDGAGCEITLGGSEGAYTLHQAGIADEKFQTEDGWSDNVNPGLFSFEAASADGYTNVYYLKCSNGKYYYWGGGIGQYGDEAWVGDTPDSFTDAYKWILVPAEDRKALTAGADVTYLIKNPDFTAYKKDWGKACTTDWTGDGVTNWAAEGTQATYYSGQFAEKWVATPGPLGDITHHQTLSGLPAGKYALSVNAQSILQGDDVAGTGAYVYAGNDQTELGLYGTYSVEFLCTGTDVEIGVKTVSTTANWLSFDKFRLTYLGEINYTDLIVNADLSTTGGWDATGTKGISGGQAKVGSGANFDFKQTITLPAGQYKVTAQAAYRYSGSEAEEYNAIVAGTDTHFYKLYATVGSDEASTEVKNRWEGATDSQLAGTSAVEVNGKYVPNSSADVLAYMRAGQYDNEVIFNITEEGPVTLGITRTGTPSVGDYGNIGAWKLERLGEADPTAVIKANIAAAEAIQNEKMQTTVSEALATAITAAKVAVESGEGIEAANTALKTAIADAQASITAYAKAANVLPEMKKLTESTNFYSEETLKAYYPAEAYEAGTLTTEEANALVNPYTVTGWRASTAASKLLLPSWKIGDVQCEDFNTSLYINTWSVEGDTDGSEFKVPFFEYWTNDNNSLGANTLTGTVTGLEAGEYNVTAWVRVRLNNNSTDQTATGITLNGVDACAGSQVGETQFRMMEVTAPATVGEDGVLTAQFTVAEDNNISWLSFQNVKYVNTIDKDEWLATLRLEVETANSWLQIYQSATAGVDEALEAAIAAAVQVLDLEETGTVKPTAAKVKATAENLAKAMKTWNTRATAEVRGLNWEKISTLEEIVRSEEATVPEQAKDAYKKLLDTIDEARVAFADPDNDFADLLAEYDAVMDAYAEYQKAKKGTINLAGQWYETTTGQYYSSNWTDFSLDNTSVTATQTDNTVTFTGLLNDTRNVLTATINADNNTLTFAKGQTIYYDGYDWEMADDGNSDLVGTINEDGTLTLDGLNIWYGSWNYMQNTKITLSRTKPAAERISMTDLALEADEESYEDGWMKIDFTYDGKILDETLDNDYLDSYVTYSLFSKDHTILSENATATFGIEAGKAGIWLGDLKANSEYVIKLTGITVKNNKEMDPETYVAPVIFEMTEGLPYLSFTTPEEPAPATIVVTPAAGTVESLQDFTFAMSDGGCICPCSDDARDLYITNAAGEKVATITQEALQAGATDLDDWWNPTKIVVSLDEAITAEGVYTLTIPAAAFYVGDNYDNCEETTVIWTIGEPTGISSIISNSIVKDGKYIINGKVVIVKNGKKFNASGARM